jgi:hypothetical protein
MYTTLCRIYISGTSLMLYDVQNEIPRDMLYGTVPRTDSSDIGNHLSFVLRTVLDIAHGPTRNDGVE